MTVVSRSDVLRAGAFFCLGFAPFSLINTLWSEVALLRHSVPEGERIGAAISAANNIGCASTTLGCFSFADLGARATAT